MMVSLRSLAVFAALPILTLAQSDEASPSATSDDSPNPRHSTCPQDIRDTANGYPVNSTGLQPFRFPSQQDSADWYLSLTINDTRAPSLDQAIQDRGNFVSVPENAQGRGCVYQFREMNVTASGDGMNGCEGVLSEGCVAELEKIMPGPTGGVVPSENGGMNADEDIECEAPDRGRIREACGDEVRSVAYIPLSFTNTTCTIPTPPAITLKSGYRTYSAVGITFADADSELDDFSRYDLRVRQTVPHVVTAYLGGSGEKEARVVCVAPTNVVEGSRVPEGDFPSAGVRGVRGQKVESWSIGFAAILAAVLMAY